LKLNSFPEFCLNGIARPENEDDFRSFSSGPENDDDFLCFLDTDGDDKEPDDSDTLELPDDSDAKCTSNCGAFLLLEKNGTFILKEILRKRRCRLLEQEQSQWRASTVS